MKDLEWSEAPIYSEDELASLDLANRPRHIAIIPDGNRRWAGKRHEDADHGHTAGKDVVMNILQAAKEAGVKTLTVYTFSTENWTRPQIEVDGLMELLKSGLLNNTRRMLANGVRFQTIGDLSRLPKDVFDVIEQTKEKTAQGDVIDLVLAINYGARDELVRATQAIAQDVESGLLKPSDLDESKLSQYLDTASWPDPDLLIRTSGELRISNFLLWQLSYSELHLTSTLWPDFTPRDLLQALRDYQQRKRRLGS